MSNSTSALNSRVWFITGSFSGFGRALVDAVIANGDRAVTTARDVAKVTEIEERHPEQVLALTLDVTSPESVGAAVNAALQRFGRIDVVVNNAGYGLLGPQPPRRLVLGADVLERILAKMSSVAEELDTWERTTVETTFEYSVIA